MTDDARRGLLDSMRLVTCLKFPFAAKKNSYLMTWANKYVINGKKPRLVLGIKLSQTSLLIGSYFGTTQIHSSRLFLINKVTLD